jgi:hypothetical protein
MKRFGLALLPLAAIAGCGKDGSKTPGSAQAIVASPSSPLSAIATDAEAGCGLHVGRPWADPSDPSRHYSVEADTQGAVCDIAVVTLTIKSPDGAALMSWSGQTRDVMGLRDAADPKSMTVALGDWLDQTRSAIHDTSALPAWDETADQVRAIDPPFHPADKISQTAWEALRGQKLGVLCFASGSESKTCYVLHAGKVEDLGLQQMPI